MECYVGGAAWGGGLLWSADETEELMGKRWRMYLVFFFISGPQRGLPDSYLQIRVFPWGGGIFIFKKHMEEYFQNQEKWISNTYWEV